MNTYWLLYPRDFDNEYEIGVATTDGDAEQYEAEGFERIDRDLALRMMSKRAPSHMQLHAGASVDGVQSYDRFETARAIRTGRPL